jgi:hypothetical protein
MTTRIREQLERIEHLKDKSTVAISALPIELSPPAADESLEKQVQSLADGVTQMILRSMDRKHFSDAKSGKQSH